MRPANNADITMADQELMGSDIIGNYLSEESLLDPNNTPPDRETQLRRFRFHQAHIANVRLKGSGSHGVALLASINDADYILKVFKKWKQPGPVYRSYAEAILMTPFACESRAFARLCSLNENGTWAVRCYGWMKLSETQLELIRKITQSSDLSHWVIVKEYEPVLTDASHISKIHENFAIAKKAKIILQDIRIENYRGSRIVDLSSSLTYPCPEWSDFSFKFFYSETISGVFHWFPELPKVTKSPAAFLIGSLVLVLCATYVLRRVKR